jgi:hypothetical protein
MTSGVMKVFDGFKFRIGLHDTPIMFMSFRVVKRSLAAIIICFLSMLNILISSLQTTRTPVSAIFPQKIPLTHLY